MREGSTTSERDARIEWVKLIAMLGVVFQHSVRASELREAITLTHGAVPAFVFISVFYSTRAGLERNNWLSWIGKRSIRLYSVFLIWNCLYFGVRLAASRGGAESSYSGFSLNDMLLSGYANAMWFIPFIVGANMLSAIAGAISKPLSVSNRVIAAAILAITATWTGLSESFRAAELDIYLFNVARKAVPASLFGCAFALLISDWQSLRVGRKWTAGLFLATFAASSIALAYYGRLVFLLETIVGISFVLTCLTWFDRESPWSVNPMYSFWIFVSHALFLHGLRKGLPIFGFNWDSAPWSFQLCGYLILIVIITIGFKILAWLRRPMAVLLLNDRVRPVVFQRNTN